MKILQINASYKPAYMYGGPIMSVSKLSEQLINAGYATEVFTTTANGLNELTIPKKQPVIVDGVPVSYYKRLTKDHSHFAPALLIAVWKRAKQFDVVHIHAWWNLVSVLSCVVALMRQVPVVVSPRGMLSAYSFYNKNAFYKKWIHNLLGKPLLKQCSIHVTSAYEKAGVNHFIKPKKTYIIPNFVEIPHHQPTGQTDSGGKLKLLFLSRIEEKKGLDILLNALTHLSIPYHLTIAGNGDEAYTNSLKNLAKQHHLTSGISWVGFQKENKFDILSNHDLLVLPSHDENFANVVIESLSVGTAVLISQYVGLADYVAENNLGWVCNTTPQSVADAINNIDKLKLATIKQMAPAIIADDFNNVQLVQQYIAMYQQITSHE